MSDVIIHFCFCVFCYIKTYSVHMWWISVVQLIICFICLTHQAWHIKCLNVTCHCCCEEGSDVFVLCSLIFKPCQTSWGGHKTTGMSICRERWAGWNAFIVKTMCVNAPCWRTFLILHCIVPLYWTCILFIQQCMGQSFNSIWSRLCYIHNMA